MRNYSQYMKVIAILLILGLTAAEELVRESRAEELRSRGLKWKVADISRSPFKRKLLETFVKSLRSGGPIQFRSKRETKADASDVLADSNEEPSDMETKVDSSIPDIDKEARATQGSQYDRWGILVNFDGRTVWGDCIHSGGTQGSCNGCWAFGIVNRLSDRFCIKGKDVKLSVQDLMECTSGNRCCEGGYASNGYRHMMQTGIVPESYKRYRKACSECRPSSCTCYKCKPNSMFWADYSTS